MAAAFGFSVGDFINGIILVKDVITVLRESGGSSQEFIDVINRLYSLERTMLNIKTLQTGSDDLLQQVALLPIIALCQSSIDRFLKGIGKYQPHLRLGGSNSRYLTGLRKIQWRLCKSKDLRRFQDEIADHMRILQLLMERIQM